MPRHHPGYLIHFGILGQKWGVRRYQNEDGTLTEEGKQRYNESSSSISTKKNTASKDENDSKDPAQKSEDKRTVFGAVHNFIDSFSNVLLHNMEVSRQQAELSRFMAENAVNTNMQIADMHATNMMMWHHW